MTLRCIRRLRLLPLLLLLLALPGTLSPAHAWGRSGHRFTNGLAIDCLPSALRPLYAANRDWIVQHSMDPDDFWRRQSRDEGPHHFIDLDKWGLEAAANFPLDYWLATGLYGKKELDTNGVVPWRIGQFYGRLVRAFKERDAKTIVEMSTWLGHYAADIHVPFHATENYDGQLTSQKGLHARFESTMVDKQIKFENLKKRGIRRIPDPVKAAFGWARNSLDLCAPILKADKEAAAKDAAYGDAYYIEFGATSRAIAVRRLEEGGADVASLWHSAWLEAGKPDLPAAADVHPGEPLDKATTDPFLVVMDRP